MKNVLLFLLGVVMVIAISSTTVSIMTVKPIKPIVTEVKSFRNIMLLEKDIKEYIDLKVKQGYIVKSVAMMDDDSWSKAIVVMEKY